MYYFAEWKRKLKKGGLFFIGLIIVALGSVFMIQASDLGVQPFDVLNIGIHKHSFISIGQASIMIGILLLLISYAMSKERLKLGTILDAIFLGTFVDLFLYFDFLIVPETLSLKITYFVLGTVFIAFGAAMTIYSELGAGPIDTFMLTLHKKFKVSVKLAATLIEISALIIGFILGGPVGIGTLLFSLLIGPLIELSLKLLNNHTSVIFEETKVS